MREQVNERGENVSPIQSLTARAQDLGRSIDNWNTVYMVAVGLTVLLAVAVFIAQFVVIRKSKLLAPTQADLIAEKDRQSAVDSKDKDVKIADAKHAAEVARETAEHERLARVELEASVAWRRLSTAQQEALSAVLSPYAGIIGFSAYNASDVEAGNFAADIAKALQRAKWKTNEPLAMLKLREGPVPLGTNPPLETGVIVRSAPDKRSLDAAGTFVAQLNSFGFDAVKSPEPILNSPPRVDVWIEHRPNGPQGEHKLRQISISLK